MAEASFPPFDHELECKDVGTRWDSYIERFENYLVTKELEPIVLKEDKTNQVDYDKREKIIKANLAVIIGQKTFSIYKQQLKADKDTYQDIKEKFHKHFHPQTNIQLNRADFRRIEQ